MSEDPRLSRCVPFPQARPDAQIRFRTGDLVALGKLMDVDHRQPPEKPWIALVIERLQTQDVDFIRQVLGLGLKSGDGFTPLPLDDPEDLRFAPCEALGPLSDAITLAMYGGTYADLREQVAE